MADEATTEAEAEAAAGGELEPAGEQGYFHLERAPIPCPAGCGREGALLAIGKARVPTLCEPCRAEAEAAEAEEDRGRRVDMLLTRAGGSPLRRGWSLESFPSANSMARQEALVKASAWIERWLGGARENVLVFGGVGGGKSGLAWGVVRRLCELEHEALFVNFRDLLYDLRQSFDERGRPGEYVRSSTVPVLVVDDVGAERPTDFAREELAVLVERRYQAQRATWFTSNYEPAELARRLGHDDLVVGTRIVSRMTAAPAVQIRIEGRDLRPA